MRDCMEKEAKTRLKRIDGQINGIINMIDDNKPCEEILMQLSAVESATKSLAKYIIKGHLTHCIVDAVNDNDMQKVEEFSTILERYIK